MSRLTQLVILVTKDGVERVQIVGDSQDEQKQGLRLAQMIVEPLANLDRAIREAGPDGIREQGRLRPNGT